MGSKLVKTPVLLLKTESIPHDGYQEYFNSEENGDYRPIFVPVLQHQVRDEALKVIENLITSEAFKDTAASKRRYGGIIFTSQRAVEAFIKVIKEVDKTKLETVLDAETPLYVVGPATARGLRTLGLFCPILGEGTGNG